MICYHITPNYVQQQRPSDARRVNPDRAGLAAFGLASHAGKFKKYDQS